MKFLFPKRNVLLSASALAVAGLLATTSIHKSENGKVARCCNNTNMNHVCIMKTILGLDTTQESKLISSFKTPEKVDASVKRGLDWIGKAQANDGGWGAGSHYNQNVKDPHAVTSDPAIRLRRAIMQRT
jgi:hypothetical protein